MTGVKLVFMMFIRYDLLIVGVLFVVVVVVAASLHTCPYEPFDIWDV